jgi:hypothetical protein
LGYFANQESAQLARARLAEWQTDLSKTMVHDIISFTSCSLYGFTDMATFIRAKL